VPHGFASRKLWQDFHRGAAEVREKLRSEPSKNQQFSKTQKV
jgi:hypothetical protein